MPRDTWEFWIDVGGTFTDCIARPPDGPIRTHKLLSSGEYVGCCAAGSTRARIIDPDRRGGPPGYFERFELSIADQTVGVREFDAEQGVLHISPALERDPPAGTPYRLRTPEEAPVAGVRWLMRKRISEPIGPVSVRLGTTRGTNALLERRGAATAFVTTCGFADVLRIAYQDRPKLFDLEIRKPTDLYTCVVEIDERVAADGGVLEAIDADAVRRALQPLREQNITALAVCLMNAYRNPAHERVIQRVAHELQFPQVSLSSQISPLQRIVPRGDTTVVDAYLAPVIRAYVDSIRKSMPDASLKLMTSSGGLVDADKLWAKDAILSGPAGGVVACARVAEAAGCGKVIGFDMGGTSTDVCRYDGRFERRYEMRLHDERSRTSVRLAAPMLTIETVAAGGGSICSFDGVKPIVGPRSAGADPGPACYGRGGPLCLTDVNVLLGRIPPQHFAFPLDLDAARHRLAEQVEALSAATGGRAEPLMLAAGFCAIANEHMAAAIKRVSVARGHDVRDYALVTFGGAGGQHACAIADLLGIRRIVSHPLAGVLSAYGIGTADVRKFAARDVGRPYERETLDALGPLFDELEERLRAEVVAEGAADADILPPERSLDLRYVGQDAVITVVRPADGDYRAAFERQHRRLYGFDFANRSVEIRAQRVEVIGRTPSRGRLEIASDERSRIDSAAGGKDNESTYARADSINAYFDGVRHETPVYIRERLATTAKIDGPAIIAESIGTLVVEPHWRAALDETANIILTRSDNKSTRSLSTQSSATNAAKHSDAGADPILLELFNNRFASIAEQMGATLQRTALSTNVKERLDFSCALFDADANLVVNAPHIPVHLGAMSACVRQLIDRVPDISPGDVFVTNHPFRGGTHLPDVTVITPVFVTEGPNYADDTAETPRILESSNPRILFFSASRAHHAEIGGLTPGSMPPFSKSLAEEGVVIDLFRLVSGGRSDEPGLRRLLASGPSPSRRIDDNIADVNAQTAANRVGEALLTDLINRHGVERVTGYMRHIQVAAERKMRLALRDLPDGRHTFDDRLDDGARLRVAVTITGDSARVDFTGTAAVLPGNLNANRAIVTSAVMYCFRCLIDDDIPLNAGVLAPIEIIVPECFLNPPMFDDAARCAAVAGGNVETSQRIVDVIFGALKVVAASQGTMNNLIFGDETFGYYETIGGGSGAGPDFDGADAVHVHMTNTRLTDPEVLEDRYPVRLRRFAIRRGSGGAGRHRGGDGIIREIEFLAPLEVSLLTQRRRTAPYGLAGGEPGKPGRNLLTRAADRLTVELDEIAHVNVRPGDVLCIETPGGGGYGALSPKV